MSSTKIPSNCVLREVRQGSWCGSGRHVHKQHVSAQEILVRRTRGARRDPTSHPVRLLVEWWAPWSCLPSLSSCCWI